MNYYIQDFCCFCLSISNEKCSKDSSKYLDNLTPFDKIKTVFIELSTVMSSDSRICLTCSKNVDFIYEFNKTCLRNINILNSYKNALNENKSKIKCDLFVNLDESKRFKNTLVSEEVEIGSSRSPLTNIDTLCDAGFVSESHSSDIAEVKQELQINCDEESERSRFGFEIKMEIEEICLKQEWTSEISDPLIDESSKPTVREMNKLKQVKIEPPESPLNNAHLSNGVDYVSENYSSGAAEVKKEIEIDYETWDEESERSCSNSDSGIKIEFDENDLKQESTSGISDPLMEESLKSTVRGFEGFPVQSAEGVMVKEEETSDLVEDLLEDAEENSAERLGHFELQEEEHFHSFQKNPIQADAQELNLDGHVLSHSEAEKHTERKAHKCDTCGRSFTRKSDLRTHILIHTGEKPHKCDTCRKLFIRKQDLQRHMLVHTGEKTHKCNTCEKSFSQKAYLKLHMLLHTGDKPHKCDTCGKSYNVKSSLRRHMVTHSGENPNECNTCGKLFSQRGHLVEHILIHTGEKPYKCNICGKSYSDPSHLRRHRFIHTDKKPHTCNACGKLFTQKATLTNHMLIHTGEKPHKCNTCEKSFTRKQDFQRHILIHTGKKPHKCDICRKSFTDPSHLRRHRLIHTDGKPYKCNICGKSFIQKATLKNHMLIHTGGKTHE